MELIQYTLTWSTFFVVAAVCLCIWLLTTKTEIGRNIIHQEISWELNRWSRLLLLIVVSVFILVNPIYHLIAVAVMGTLYYVFLADNRDKSIFRLPEHKGTQMNIGLTNEEVYSYSFYCKGESFSDLLQERTKLEQCLFSFPFIGDDPFPEISYMEDRFEVGLSLSNEQYLASLVDYIKGAGFQIEIKNK